MMNRSKILLCVMVMLSASVWCQAAIIGQALYNGHTYYLLEPKWWNEAEAEAQILGGHLVIINDDAENQWIYNTFSQKAIQYASDHSLRGKISLWLGASDSQTEGIWVWIDGTPLANTYTNWQPNEPAGAPGDQDYAGMVIDAGDFTPGKWHDLFTAADPTDLPFGVVEVVNGLSSPIQWTVESGGNGHWYALTPIVGTWTEANALATSFSYHGKPGHLVSILSQEENDFLVQSLLGTDTYWIGLTDGAQEGTWIWTSGETATYENWIFGEPNNAGGAENYGSMLTVPGHAGDWNDLAHYDPVSGAEIRLRGIIEYDYANVVPEWRELTYSWAHPMPWSVDEAQQSGAAAVASLVTNVAVGGSIKKGFIVLLDNIVKDLFKITLSSISKIIGGFALGILTEAEIGGFEARSDAVLVRNGVVAENYVISGAPYVANCLINPGDEFFYPTKLYVEKKTGLFPWEWDITLVDDLLTEAEAHPSEAAGLSLVWLVKKTAITFPGPGTYRVGCGYRGDLGSKVHTIEVESLPREAPSDVDADAVTDLTVWRPSSGYWYSLKSTDHTVAPVMKWGSESTGDIPVPGDYDGDGLLDLAVWRPSKGIWYVRKSTLGYSNLLSSLIHWGTNGDIPVPGDYDGDGKTDAAIWRPGNGNWYIWPSASYESSPPKNWGSSAEGDIPVPGDYDGDGKTDIAVWRPSKGTWLILKSSESFCPANFVAKNWGLGSVGDIPVPADYDGDGRTDLAVWRKNSGIWYIWPSTSPETIVIKRWGVSTDTPVAADFDGDNKADIAVWRPGNGVWYILPSSSPNVYTTTAWGTSGDIPISSLTTILKTIP